MDAVAGRRRRVSAALARVLGAALNRRAGAGALTLAGLSAVVVGVAVIWWPAAVILGGAALMALGLLGIDVGGRPRR